MVQVTQMTPAPGVLIVAALSLAYLCSSDIFALINYVGFATWVTTNYQVCSAPQLVTSLLCPGLHRAGRALHPLAALETPGVGAAHQGDHIYSIYSIYTICSIYSTVVSIV